MTKTKIGMLIGTLLFNTLSFHAVAATENSLTLGLAADVTSLDPQYVNAAPNIGFAHHIFETLTDVDADGHIIPRLAASWRAIDDTTWEFKLHSGVKFHDGSELTAEDVIFSLDRPATLINSPGPFTSYTKQIVDKKAVGKYTVILKTASAYGALPLDLSSIFILSKKASSQTTTEQFNAGQGVIGTGPFKLVKFQSGEQITLVRNDQYWGKTPEWKNVTFRILPNASARLNALLAKDVDAIEGVPPADLAKLRGNGDFDVIQHKSWRTLFWHLDQHSTQSPEFTDLQGNPLPKNPLLDIRVRQAFSKAINREVLSSRVLEGLGTPASNINAPGVLGYNPAIKVERYDPEGARKLLAEAGYPQGFGLTLHGPNNRYINDQQIVETTAQLLNKVGIRAKVDTQPLASYLPKAKAHSYGVALLGWGSLAADFTLRTIVGTPDDKTGWGTWNWGQYSNPKVDSEIRAALASVDQKQRDEHARQAAELALRDYAVIPSHHQYATWAVRKGLTYQGRLDEFTYAEYFHRK